MNGISNWKRKNAKRDRERVSVRSRFQRWEKRWIIRGFEHNSFLLKPRSYSQTLLANERETVETQFSSALSHQHNRLTVPDLSKVQYQCNLPKNPLWFQTSRITITKVKRIAPIFRWSKRPRSHRSDETIFLSETAKLLRRWTSRRSPTSSGGRQKPLTVKVVWAVLRGGRHGDVRSLTRHWAGADKSLERAPQAASNVTNSHEKRREKAKMRGILSVNTTVPQLVHAPHDRFIW